ncbi:dedicator of cytokinesis protein 9 isoform X2 [Nilaparvata lugens]|uniref:dedicator of cytokinesis protein 9 isoform X1 n=1 Tax=Nilaparvata lugens TaxID=108931 RepID=UPI00193C8980|nr:dedicator of cytokinesis protein 9 isoform X1 [Nilaparvata lugens]XP_039279989.1 dedicator of cytokinesis protein 9 isoform X2 [Nilaparvata lugens]
MSERKFSRGLGKPGMAAQLRETVSQVVRESTVQQKANHSEPLDYESFIVKNKTLLQNDPQRELLLYPPDDVSQVVLPRRFRTVTTSVPQNSDTKDCSLFSRECIKSYTSNWNLVHYKYSAYSGTYLELPKIMRSDDLKDEVYEVDTDADQLDEELEGRNDGITKQGYLLKGPEVGNDRMFGNIASKSFKRRYCYLRREVDGTYILELHKDEKKGEAKATIVMDFCTDVVRNMKRGRFCFELHMADGHKSYCLAADSEAELQDWMAKLQLVLQQNKVQEEKRAASLERASASPQTSVIPLYGTLKGLEQSVNPQLMKYARETDNSIALARRDNRRRLFSVYPFMPHTKCAQQTMESTIEPYREHFGQRLLIRCESIRFRLQAPINGDSQTHCQVEPYLTTLALYDAKDGKKLTEDFHMDVNHSAVDGIISDPDEPVESILGDLVPPQWIAKTKQAVFSISRPHADVYLVLRIDKILQGSIMHVAEPYTRSAKDPRLGLKVHKAVKACSQRLGKYRMPFAWTARPLFRLYSSEPDITSDFPGIYRQEPNRIKDEELLKILADYRKPEKMNKLPAIPGWIHMKIEILTELPENCLTSCMSPLKPFPVPPSGEPTVEVAELQPEPRPHTAFANLLFVYPLSLAFDAQKTFTRARNIACTIQLKDTDDESAEPITCIYGRGGKLVGSATCCVLHHTTTPAWYDEIKMRLPVKLTANHHLLFTFTHISIEGSKKRDTGPETTVGYAWLPLLNKGRSRTEALLCKQGLRLNVEDQSIPVAATLPPGYLAVQPLGLGRGYAGPEINWIDGQKSIFAVNFRLLSTVLTQDHHLHNLFAHAERLHEPKLQVVLPPETETCKILKAAHAIQVGSAIAFLPTLLNQLLGLLVCSPSPDVGVNVIRLLIHVVHLVDEAGCAEALQTYVKFVFVGAAQGSRTVHEELCEHLPSLLRPDNTDFLLVNKFLPHSGFFFQIMVKSMAQHLLSTGRIKMLRNERFSPELLAKIEALLQVLTPYLASKHKEMPQQMQQLNNSIATFLKKCLTFLDRGFVFKLVNSHLANLLSASESRTMQEMKFAFLQVVCSHEHFVPFNLPLQHSKARNGTRFYTLNLTSEYCLSEEFCKHHYLVGILLQEVRASLHQVLQIRRTAVSSLRDLLAKHELDDRYQSKGQLPRIATLYIPWLGIVLDNLTRLSTDPGQATSSNSPIATSSSSIASTPQKNSHRFTFHQDSPNSRASMHLRDSTYFAAIAGQALVNGVGSTGSLDSETSTVSGDGSSTVSQETAINREEQGGSTTTPNTSHHSRSVSGTQVIRCDKLQPGEVKDILVCFLFVIKHLAQDQLISWWHHCSESEILKFFKVIELCLHEFKYTGKRQIASGSVGGGRCGSGSVGSGEGGGGTRPVTTKAMTLPARMQPPDFSAAPGAGAEPITATHVLLSGTNSVGRENHRDSESSSLYQALLEANLATEVGLTVLDALGLYCIHFKDILMAEEGDNPVMKAVFMLYLSFLQVGQSETLFRHVFAALRAFINNFSLALFQGNAVLCGQLCLELLRCCNSRLSAIRQESCAILYLLMRSNFEFSNRKGLTRVHLQVIISVSQLLGNVVGLNNARFQESLSLINSYANSDKVMKGTGFPVEVKDLTKRIRTVLMATAQMRDLHHDPEMLTDLQHSLANSYASTPELRLTWLMTMTRNHAKDNNFSEVVH